MAVRVSAIILDLGQGLAAECHAAWRAGKVHVAALLRLDGIEALHVIDQLNVVIGNYSSFDGDLYVFLATGRAVQSGQAMAHHAQHVINPSFRSLRGSFRTVKHGQGLLFADDFGEGWI